MILLRGCAFMVHMVLLLISNICLTLCNHDVVSWDPGTCVPDGPSHLWWKSLITCLPRAAIGARGREGVGEGA